MLSGKDALTDLNRGAGIQHVRDGTANTIAFVLAGADRADFWTRPYDLPFESDKPLDALGKIESGKIPCVMANCQPLTLSADISPETFAALVTPNGGEVVDVATLRRREDLRRGTRFDNPNPAVPQTASSPSPEPVLVQNTGPRPARRHSSRAKSPASAPRSDAAPASTPPLDMPEDYSDYALNPETGDILALSVDKGEAVLFRGKDLDARKIEPAAKVRVGSTPCVAFFKRYHDLRVFAVICSQDAHMYVINAAEGTLLKKIDLSQSGVSNVTGSINPDDPFVYYNFGGGHGSIAGVVNLRSMENQAQAFNSSMDCAFSASGEIAYRRGPWSPSGFESLIRTNSLNDDKPAFVRLFYQHTSTLEYIPDPFDRYVAAGTSIYSRSLEKNEADLNFMPQCFFRSRPLIIGVSATRVHGLEQPSNIVLNSASYNTFSAIGTPVRLALAGSSDNGELPRGVATQADFKRVSKRTRVFADDARKKVIYAARRQIFFVGLDEFKLPDEPFLQATLEGSHALATGQTSSLSVKLLDPRATITFDDLADGMKANGSQLQWQPRGDQLGPAKVTATIKAGDIQRTTTFELHVVYPSIALPFALAGMSVNPPGTQAVIWDGPPSDRPHTASPEQNRAEGCALARVDLESGNVLAKRRLSEAIRRAVLTDEYAVLLTESLSPRCELFRAVDLKR
jgi:hypothetical protein